MKKLNLVLLTTSIFTALLLVTQLAFAQTAPTRTTKKPPATTVVPMESLSLNFTKIVPEGKTYAIYNSKGRKVRDIKAGESTAGQTDCAQIPCPSTFGDDVVCWKCVESITSG